MTTVAHAPQGACPSTRFVALAGLVAAFVERPALPTLDLATRALQAAWTTSEHLSGQEATLATRTLWEGERALSAARRALLVADPHRGLTPPPACPLACAEALVGAVEVYAAHGLTDDAGLALSLAWPALHLAARAGLDAGRLAAVSRSLRLWQDALAEGQTPVEEGAYANAA